MKRFTLALIALLSVVVVFADGPKKQLTKLPTMPAKASMPLRQKLDIKEAPASLTMKKAPAQATPRRGPRKAPSAADLEGVYTWDYLKADKLSTDIDSIETTSYSNKVTITQSETTEGGLTISGMFTNTLEATIDGDYIVIESGQAAGVSDYGAYTVVGGFYYEGDEENPAGWYSWDIHGKIQDDGSICFEDWIVTRLTDGEYAGYSFGYYVSGSTLTLSLVKVPEGVEIVPYVMFYYDPFLEVNATIPVNVAVDGNDVYFQGLGAGAYLPNAWVKGTKSGNIVTFPENQYMGQGPLGSTYGFSYGGDGVFTYAPVTDIYTAEGYVGVTIGGSTETFYNPVLKRVIERAAMPANPAILSLDGGNFNRLDINVLLKDTDGAPLDASKLSYMIYTDTDGNISPLTFTPTTHYALTEDLTEIPYGFTDNSHFTQNCIYLDDLYSSDWDRIGIQSIYTCGGERNATPIQWFENKEAYAVVKGNTLTFYYDSERATRGGLSYNMPYYGNIPGWTSYNGNTTITTATFDESFKNYTGLKNTGRWFYYLKALTTINHFDYLNTDNVTDMTCMFLDCSSLVNLDITNLNTANVRDMSGMFYGCSSLTTIDLSNFDMTNVTDTRWMFQDCTNLTTIYCNADWSLGVVSESEEMFDGCTSLVGAVSYDKSNIDISFANPITGYFTVNYELEPYAVVDGNTLTFYYDRRRVLREGVTYDLPSSAGVPDWTSYNNGEGNTSVTTVTFDESFENYTGLTSTRSWFYYMRALTTINHLDYLNTDNVTDMSCMFMGCSSLSSLDITNLNTANVTDMSAMFSGCSSLTALDVAGLNTANVTNMSSMFNGCSNLTFLDVAGLNTANVTNMNDMFCDCQALERLDVSNFITDNVTSMRSMFADCHALTSLDVTNFNTANVTDMYFMFHGCSALTDLDVTNFNTANVTDMSEMFSNCLNLTSLDLSGFNTANVTRMPQMFGYSMKLESLNVANFDMTNVTDTRWMFKDCSNLTTIYCNADWSLGVVTESEGMFDNCPSLQGAVPFSSDNDNDISFANPTNGYFTGAEAYAVVDKDLQSLTFYYDFNKSEHESDANKDVFGVVNNDWYSYPDHIFSVTIDESMENYHGLTTTSKMFKGLYEVRGEIKGLRYLNTEHVTDMSNMFEGCQNLDSLDLSHFNTSQVTDMRGMFDGCSALETLDLSNFNTSNVTDMADMFNYCMALKSVDLSSFNTSKVEYMAYMFNECESLLSLDLTNFDMRNVTEAEAMFAICEDLTTIYCNDDWSDYPLRHDCADLFNGCVSLVGAVPYESEFYDYISRANPDTGYFTRKLMRGDVNGDSKVTIADVTALVNIILGKTTNYNAEVADINSDTKITIADVTALVNLILGK